MAERTVMTRLKADISDFNRGMLEAGASAKAFTKELDTSTDRAVNLTQSILAIGPALVPISAAAVPAIAGLTNELGFAAAGAGVAVLAFHGVGDALKATNDYAIEPTTANFQKMQDSLAKISPAGREFVAFLQQLRPQLQTLQDAAQNGLFPGAEAGINDLLTRMPEVEQVISTVASSIGDLIADAGDNLADPRWDDFFAFLEKEAKPTIVEMGKALGNFAEGFANLWMAFSPLADDFSSSFLDLARDFAQWTDGLDQTEGFQEFIAYVERVGPKAFDTLGALGDALLQLVEAAAPVGEATLPILTAFAKTIGTLADSDIGPFVIGLVSLTSAYSRLIALGNSANSSALGSLLGKSAFGGAARAAKDLPEAARGFLQFDAAAARAGMSAEEFEKRNGRLSASLKGAVKVAGGVGGLAFVMSDLDDKLGLSNTAMGALAGTAFGPFGTAIGGGIGLVKDLSSANDGLWAAVSRADQALSSNAATIEQQSAAVAEARRKADELATSVSPDAPKTFGNEAKAFKNDIEGIFGKSDVEESNEALKKLEDQLAKNKAAALENRLAEAGLSDSMAGASDAAREQVDSVLKLIDAHNKLTDQALASADAEIAFEQALDDASDAAKKNGENTDINTQKGRDNKEALLQLAGAWNALTPEQQNAAGASDRARESFVQIARQMGYTKKEAKALADQYLDIPTVVSTNIKVTGGPEATAVARAVKAALDSIPSVKNSTIRTTYQDVYTAPKHSDPKPSIGDLLNPNYKARADGGPIVGPGGPRDDAIPTMLSNGEYVVNAASAAKNMSLLHAINYGGLQRMADGGSVGVASASSVAPVLDLDGLAERLAQRPVVVTGKVIVNGREAGVFYQEGAKFAGTAS